MTDIHTYRKDAPPITAGRAFIHRNIHLTKPTLTVVVRTVWDGIRQYTYYEPGLALESSMSNTQNKQLQLLRGLNKFDRALASRYLRELLSSDIQPGHAYRCLQFFLRQDDPDRDLEALLHIARRPLGHMASTVEQALRRPQSIEPDLSRLLLG
jgi:hypothetical protein